MRYFLLAFLMLSVTGCDGAEPIAAMSSPAGCWQSDGGRLDLMPTGEWRQTFNVSPTTDSGTWTYDDKSQMLTLSIVSASSANDPAVAFSRVVGLTPTEMWTAGGDGWTHWQAIACQ